MESLKKVISLNQAAKISGYHQDYLGFLVRKGELRGKKIGRTWFTTEAEIRSYILKQKVRSNKFGFTDFFSLRRIRKIFFIGIIILISSISFSYIASSKSEGRTVQTILSTEVEIVEAR